MDMDMGMVIDTKYRKRDNKKAFELDVTCVLYLIEPIERNLYDESVCTMAT